MKPQLLLSKADYTKGKKNIISTQTQLGNYANRFNGYIKLKRVFCTNEVMEKFYQVVWNLLVLKKLRTSMAVKGKKFEQTL